MWKIFAAIYAGMWLGLTLITVEDIKRCTGEECVFHMSANLPWVRAKRAADVWVPGTIDYQDEFRYRVLSSLLATLPMKI